MAKFCGNCGKPVEDGTKVCGNCGTPIASENIGNTLISNISGGDNDSEKKAKNKKLGMMIIGGVALIVVLVVAINLISGSVGYKGAVRKIMNAYKNRNINTLVNMSSDFLTIYGDLDYAFESLIDSDRDYFEYEVGDNYKISYEITNSFKLDEYQFNQFMINMADYDHFNADKISEVRVFEIEVTAKQGKRTETLYKQLVLTKENGSWKFFEM